ncbi:leucine-rich repeat-containing G-protein coupled receptor 5-like [Mytilus californianus]|uniref:leucine-rich repeat-containing G-protein coupled receptor 5-like n=1 Tax=Mytilus californianus TaxID=6549 RepID=UPI0022471CC5|nr:leucine-rich repeat-containing G-protein coupled receptor 5-like [Mytilus californianus]
MAKRNYEKLKCVTLLMMLVYCASAGTNCENECPKFCHCSGLCNSRRVDCSGKNLTAVPDGIPDDVVNLDLSMNNMTSFPDNAFLKFRKLEELRLAGNKLTDIPPKAFQDLYFLKVINLQHNSFTKVPAYTFQNLSYLRELDLDANYIEDVPDEAFKRCRSLQLLQLDANQLTKVPTKALQYLKSLHALDLSVNKLTNIPDYAFRNLTNLIELILHENKIEEISDHAFEGLTSLSRLELPMNNLRKIPAAFISLKDLEKLSLEDNRIDFIPDNSFAGNKKLEILKLRRNPIRSFGTKAFKELPNLKELIISEARDMTEFPDLSGSVSLRELQFDRSSISKIPDNFCDMVPEIQRLDLHTNKLSELPVLSGCLNLKLLNIGENEIKSLQGRLFVNNSNLRDLILSHNCIASIGENSFVGLANLQYLDLSHNEIAYIHDKAFSPLENLDDLNLSENKFPSLPMDGLQNLQQLKTFHNQELRDPIPAKELPKIKTLVLSYAYHCCDFLNPAANGELKLEEHTNWLFPNTSEPRIGNGTNLNHPYGEQYVFPFNHYHYKQIEYFAAPADKDFTFPDTPDVQYPEEEISVKSPIQCEPLPGPFLPCNDLFGWWTLRCGIWIVFMLSIFGNGTVLFVSISGRSTMNVPRFLICNLALADFCMGVYLGILAVVDASTLGEFKNYAIDWQTSPGCLVAGFLGIVSSELSVFTLMIITVERHYAIANAMQFNKRLSLRKAGIIMTVGWLFCGGLASLPLFDISNYRKFAICLPFDINDKASLGFVCFIMLFNATSFIVIGGCYVRMYVYILKSQAWNSKDFRVAKRMAVLVVTDFLCWAPIIFFSVSAAFGSPLVGLNEAKVLTIFVLPLNSCANPFLYAIFTKQFKRDCVKLCKRIEESSISRSFSNFNSLRLSFGINASCRNSELHSPFHEKRGSSRSNSDSFASSSVGIPNQNGEIDNINGQKSYTISDRVFQNLELKHGIDRNKRKPLLHANNNSQFSPDKECACQRCKKQNTISVGSGATDTEIVIHLDRNGEKVIPNDGPQQLNGTNPNDVALNDDSDNETSKSDDKLLSKITDELCTECGNNRNSIHCKHYCQIDRKLKDTSVRPKSNIAMVGKMQHTKSAPFVPCRSNENILKLSQLSANKDKTSHINEWRKSSHLSFLWRNSLDLDTGMPKYKSNSLVELARLPKTFDRSPSKRRSLSSRHEGYLLFKNLKRDSAYENEEEMFEYEENLKDFPVQFSQNKYSNCDSEYSQIALEEETDHDIQHSEVPKVQEAYRNKTDLSNSNDDDDVDETQMLLTESNVTNNTLKRDVCDKESGFSSDSQLLKC